MNWKRRLLGLLVIAAFIFIVVMSFKSSFFADLLCVTIVALILIGIYHTGLSGHSSNKPYGDLSENGKYDKINSRGTRVWIVDSETMQDDNGNVYDRNDPDFHYIN